MGMDPRKMHLVGGFHKKVWALPYFYLSPQYCVYAPFSTVFYLSCVQAKGDNRALYSGGLGNPAFE